MGEKVRGVEISGEWNANASPVFGLRKEIMDILVRGYVVVESKNLENKTSWLKRGKEGHLFVFFVLQTVRKALLGLIGD